MAVLYPRDDFARVFKVLTEDLGADPRDLKTTTDGPGLGLVIPDDLFERLTEAENSASDEDSEQEPPRKRAGRPRKIQE